MRSLLATVGVIVVKGTPNVSPAYECDWFEDIEVFLSILDDDWPWVE